MKKKDNNIERVMDYSLHAMSIDKFISYPLKSIIHRFKKNESGMYLLKFDVEGSYSLHNEVSVIQSLMNTTVHCLDYEEENKLYEVFNMECAFDFYLHNMEQYYNEKGEFILPHKLSITLTSVSYGTLRGALFVSAQGSPLGNIMMPLLDVMRIPRNDLLIVPNNEKTN